MVCYARPTNASGLRSLPCCQDMSFQSDAWSVMICGASGRIMRSGDRLCPTRQGWHHHRAPLQSHRWRTNFISQKTFVPFVRGNHKKLPPSWVPLFWHMVKPPGVRNFEALKRFQESALGSHKGLGSDRLPHSGSGANPLCKPWFTQFPDVSRL